MKLDRTYLPLALAGGFALLMPLVLLAPLHRAAPAEVDRSMPRLVAPAAAPLARAFERPLFAAAPAGDETPPQDAPQLVGIVGRLGTDAVALVRGADGATRTLQIGESVDGWRLASLAIDAAFFVRGTERVRVPLPAG